MSLRQVVRPRSSNNGYGRWRAERDTGVRLESRLQAGKSDARKLLNAGEPISKARDVGSCSRDRLVYLAACLIGHDVEVQVRNGSIYAGIFHATNAEDDFGIILKMARLIKDGSSQGQIAISESISTAPSKVLIIPAKELVQVMAKDVSLTMDRLTNELQEKQQEILLDSFISQSHQLEMERELQPWVPDDDAPRPEFENVFDEPWNRKWDQFEANETLFGVKSTFDEELYTTKLEKGPQMRELEREASRLAKEIEGEETHDSHTAEERGFQYHDDLDIDEETRYSSVSRGIDDNGYKENEDANVDSCNSETFEGSSDSVTDRSLAGLKSCQSTGAPVSNNSSTTEEANAFQLGSPRSLYHPNSDDHAKQLASELVSKHVPALDGERVRDDESSGSFQPDGCAEKKIPAEEDQLSNAEDLHSSLDIKNDLCDKGSLSPNAISYAPASCFASSGEEKANSVEISGGASFSKTQVTAPSGNSRAISGGFTASPSECVGNASPFSGPKLSPSSSAGSLSSEKSVLNPHAKEFKLNPNAKSFIPSPAPSVRPPSPGCDGSLYFPPTVSAGPHMAASGFGMGHQAVVVNPQGAYYSANGPPQYGQQMIVGHPRPYLYMPNYPHEMAYKGRDF